jgi:hypothetical protein
MCDDQQPDQQADQRDSTSNIAKAATSIIIAVCLVLGINIDPDHAVIWGTVAAALIPLLPSAYRGISCSANRAKKLVRRPKT